MNFAALRERITCALATAPTDGHGRSMDSSATARASSDVGPDELRLECSLEGVLAGSTAICATGATHDTLVYRGYGIGELAEHVCFEEVVWLLLHGDLPSDAAVASLRAEVARHRVLPPVVVSLLETLPADTPPMDMLRTVVSLLGATTEPGPPHKVAVRLLGVLPLVLGAWEQRRTRGAVPAGCGEPAIADESLAAHLLRMVAGTDDPTLINIFDGALILYAEHEFNASSFTSRVVCSTGADAYAALTGSIGALKGWRHGGANEAALRLLREFAPGDDVRQGVLDRIQGGKRLMGFGHRIYRDGDPRALHMKAWAAELARYQDDWSRYRLADEIEAVALEAKNLHPNVDFWCAPVFDACGIPIDLFTPIFAIARTPGWIAHVIEQEEISKLIRPSSQYVGPVRRVVRRDGGPLRAVPSAIA